MKYRWAEDIEEFRHIATAWDEALITSGNHNPFLLSDFIITWWKYFYNNLQLRIFIAYDNNRILGGIPLYIRRWGLRHGCARILHHIGGSAANYTEAFYGAPGAKILALLKESLVKKGDWDVLYLPDVRGESELMAEYRNCTTDERFLFYVIQDHMNWAIDLSDGQERYLSTISSKLKRDLRAKRKRLVKNYGELRLKEIKGKEEVEKHFDLYSQFSLHTFTARGRNSNFENKKYTTFFRDFLSFMVRKQRLDTHVLLAGDKVLAISFGYRFGKGFNWVLTGFNYDYKYFRPGYLLIEELIKEICNRGETYYNWYSYERFYKTQWCNSQTPLYRFFLIRRTLKGTCYRMLQAVERVLRSNRMIVGLVQKLKLFN